MAKTTHITLEPTGTHEAHALRTHIVEVSIPEAQTSHYKIVAGCKCGWLDYTLRSSGDLRDAYRKHKEKMVRFYRRPEVEA